MARKLLSFFYLFLAFLISYADKHYIDPVNGRDSGAGASEAKAWKTIGKANGALAPGDTVFIMAGTYKATISPTNSGTSSQPIVYMNFGSDMVILSDTVYGMYLDGKSYIVVQGITMKHQDRFVYLRNKSNHNTLAWCVFDSAKLKDGETATWAGSVISGCSQHNWIHHCQFSNYGYYTDDDISCVLDIGAEEDKTDSTCFNLIENSQFFHGGHHVVGIYGKFNVIRNNYFHNEPWSMGTEASDRGAVLYGDRNLSFSGYKENGGRNLIERNRIGYSADPSDNTGASGASLNSSENIVRFNAFFNNISAGLSMSVTESYLQDILRNKIYNNTFFNNGHNPYDSIDHMSSGIGFGIYSGPLVIKDNALKNNILFKHKLTIGEYNINTTDRTGLLANQVFTNNWDGDKKGDPQFIDATIAQHDPFNAALPDLHLMARSPCIDSGTYLTTIASASGSGTFFQVADAGYFMDGWGIAGVSGDEIQLFGTNQRARILKVNYATNSLVVDKNLTWTDNQGVSLAYEGAAPDIGAYEFGAENSVIFRCRKALSSIKQEHSSAVYDILGRKTNNAVASFAKGRKSGIWAKGVYFSVIDDGKAAMRKRVLMK
jgi:hypothetical protein